MLTRTVILLSLVSFFADIASEMLYPIMPLYLQYIGFSAVGLGFLEGLANAMAGLSKGYFGHLSDTWRVRMPFVRVGYALSAISKPLMAVCTATGWILGVRILDRLGKGIRTAPRDAVLSAESSSATRGRVFGFHRTLDTLGATLGPVVALCLLYVYPQQYALIFGLAFIPGILSVFLTLAVRDIPVTSTTVDTNQQNAGNPFRFLGYWHKASPAYRRAVGLFVCFALVNSADAFLLLRLHDIGFSDVQVVGVYIFYNAIFALLSYPLGALGDRWGMKPTYLGGLVLFAVAYIGMGLMPSFYGALGLFLVYGIYAAATESIAKAWISRLCDRHETATAVGMYATLVSIATLLASIWTGFVWQYAGATWAFFISGIVALMLVVWGMIYVDNNR